MTYIKMTCANYKEWIIKIFLKIIKENKRYECITINFNMPRYIITTVHKIHNKITQIKECVLWKYGSVNISRQIQYWIKSGRKMFSVRFTLQGAVLMLNCTSSLIRLLICPYAYTFRKRPKLFWAPMELFLFLFMHCT